MPRCFPPAWSIEVSSACFIVRDHDKQALACICFENEPGRRSSAKLLARDEAFPIGEPCQAAECAATSQSCLCGAAIIAK